MTLALPSIISRTRSRCIASADPEVLGRRTDTIPANPITAIAISAIVRSDSYGLTDPPPARISAGNRRCGGPSRCHEPKLPRIKNDTMDPGVGAEASGRRHPVR